MAGEMKYTAANTTASQSADPRLAEAFCQGREAQVAGDSSNPFATGSEQNAAWQAGHDTVTPEGLVDNCALAIPITVANVVGASLSAATATLLAQHLLVGQVSLTTGNVTIQDPAAAAKVQPNQAVHLTLTS